MRLKMAQRLIKYGTQLDIVLEKDNLVSPGRGNYSYRQNTYIPHMHIFLPT